MMTKAHYTAGPWKVGGHPWNILADSGLVASAQFRGYTPTALERAEVDANAKLIAAAPSLLEACIAAEDTLAQGSPPETLTVEDVLRLLRGAIKEAIE